MKADDTLTPAELEVLDLTSYGHNATAIAKRTFRSKDTVRTHHEKIRRKLKMPTMPGAVGEAFRRGILPLRGKNTQIDVLTFYFLLERFAALFIEY